MFARHLFLIIMILFASECFADANEDGIFHTNQTSATMLINYAEDVLENASIEEKMEAKMKYVLLYDIYIKADAYSFLNKVFFWLSIISAIAVLLWPSLNIVFKSKLDNWEWLKSATVQTTVTAIAALMFTFYSQYKDKQTYAETLMRYVIYSDKTTTNLSILVSEELSRIDRGFSFNRILGNDNNSIQSNSKASVD